MQPSEASPGKVEWRLEQTDYAVALDGPRPLDARYDGLAAIRVSELGAAILHDPGTLDALGLPLPRARVLS